MIIIVSFVHVFPLEARRASRRPLKYAVRQTYGPLNHVLRVKSYSKPESLDRDPRFLLYTPYSVYEIFSRSILYRRWYLRSRTSPKAASSLPVMAYL
jgi:hypothetical protein